MRITESRLRRIIRSVIKESRNKGMSSLYGMEREDLRNQMSQRARDCIRDVESDAETAADFKDSLTEVIAAIKEIEEEMNYQLDKVCAGISMDDLYLLDAYFEASNLNHVGDHVPKPGDYVLGAYKSDPSSIR